MSFNSLGWQFHSQAPVLEAVKFDLRGRAPKASRRRQQSLRRSQKAQDPTYSLVIDNLIMFFCKIRKLSNEKRVLFYAQRTCPLPAFSILGDFHSSMSIGSYLILVLLKQSNVIQFIAQFVQRVPHKGVLGRLLQEAPRKGLRVVWKLQVRPSLLYFIFFLRYITL